MLLEHTDNLWGLAVMSGHIYCGKTVVVLMDIPLG